MLAPKRKAVHLAHSDSEFDQSSDSGSWVDSDASGSDPEVDITTVLAGKDSKTKSNSSKKRKVKDGDRSGEEELGDDDGALQAMIQRSITQRNVKSGTEVLKKSKGKVKMIKGEVGGGSFQSMGLHPSLLRALTLQGFRIPTPIQRLAIPSLLASPPRDLVGMARTGSGKSLAYMIPLIQRLAGRHSTVFGARALILIPTRELALQILKVGKSLARGWHGDSEHAGDAKDVEDNTRGTSLRWGLVVGGEGMDEQFEMITNNPDIIIATPGRLLHLIVEMDLDLKSVQYVVFDEADRLFEMGFETALNEILHRLPTSRQTLLFSATLPKSLVEFAKAGLQDPKLVRLDAESKISSDLKMAFFSVKQVEKDACLLTLLRDVIKVPMGFSGGSENQPSKDDSNKKQKHREQVMAPHQTLVFAATKHHVEYIQTLLSTAGYAVSHIYGSLDQTARTYQMDQFRRGTTNILVVTDVAARGIDIPVLENVVNYDFPQSARVFVHRVGRTARAGRQGWAWSFVTNTDLPYLLDLQLFLGRPLTPSVPSDVTGDTPYTECLVLGTFIRTTVDEDVEFIRRLEEVNHSLPSLRDVMTRGHSMYERSKGKASPQSYQRAKEMIKDTSGKWYLAGSSSDAGVHPVLFRGDGGRKAEVRRETEEAKKALLKAVNAFRPAETVFEVQGKGKGGNKDNGMAALMKERRKALDKAQQRAQMLSTSVAAGGDEEADSDGEDEADIKIGRDVEMADEEEIAAVFNISDKKGGKNKYRDSEFYMSYEQKGAETEKGYSLNEGASSFAQQARGATFDLTNDEGKLERNKNQLTWDKKKKKFVKGDGVGADNVKLVKTENGTRLPATYRSGRYDEWKNKTHTSLPRVGEQEGEGVRGGRSFAPGGKKFKHNRVVDAKPLDKFAKDYDRKARQLKKKSEGAVGESSQPAAAVKNKGTRPGGRYGGKPISKVKSELKTTDQIRKTRAALENRRAKNGRHSNRKKGGRR